MPRSENGGVVGARNFTSINAAPGVYQLKNQFVANITSGWPRSGNIFVAFSQGTASPLSVYSFSSLGGFNTKLSNPGTAPTGNLFSVRFSNDGKSIAFCGSVSPYVFTYPWSTSGFGTKFSDPATLPAGSAQNVRFNTLYTAIAVGHQTTPFISVYPWSGSGFGSKFSNPSTLPGSTTTCLSFTNTNDIIVGSQSPYLSAYPFNTSTGFGTRYVTPGSQPGGVPLGLAVGNKNDSIAVAAQTASPYYGIWAWTNLTGFGTRYSDPTSIFTESLSSARNADFSPSDSAVAFGVFSNSNSGYLLWAYPWSSSTGFGTIYSSTNTNTVFANISGGSVYQPRFHPSGNYLFIAYTLSPFAYAFPWDDVNGIGTKLADPSSLPGAAAYGVDVKVV